MPTAIAVLSPDETLAGTVEHLLATADRPALVRGRLPADRLPDSLDTDLLVLDAREPHRAAHAFALLRTLRRQLANLPTLVLLPAAEPARRAVSRQSLQNGATDVLAEPLDPAELALRVGNLTALRRQRDRLLQLDPLTGLANRAEFQRRMARLLAGPSPQARTLLVLNLDRFNPVNASLGFAAGDTLLQATAQRLANMVAGAGGAERRDAAAAGQPATPWVARLESDGFAALLPGARGDVRLETSLAALGRALAQPYPIAGRELVVTASIGLASFPADAADAGTLLQRASQALAYAKRRGGRRMVWFDGVVERRAADRLLTEQQLRRAIGADELRLWYQPKVDCATGLMVGVEALVRWQHPERGLLGPQWFVPVAEASGLIVELGSWVAREACRQGRRWLDQGLPPLGIAINVSVAQTRRDGLVTTIRDALSTSGFPADRLTIELTESLLIGDDEATAQMVRDLKALGVNLSLDDFGTGYASMTMLRRFAFDEIKIDRSFVRGLPANAEGAAITRAIAGLASDLGLRVVAEGVESAAELAFLRGFPGSRYQGELFSRPVDAAALARMLAEDRTGPRQTPDPSVPAAMVPAAVTPARPPDQTG